MCTIGVAFSEKATYVFKNRDLKELVLMSDPLIKKGRYRYIAFPRPSGGIWFGVNEHGIALTASDAHTIKKYPSQKNAGDMITSIYESIIANASTLKEAEKIMTHSFTKKITVPDMLIIADSKTALAYEYTPEKQCNDRMAGPPLLRANTFLLLEGAPSKEVDPSSHLRYEREKELLSGKVTLRLIKKTLKDHKNGPGENSICRHGKKKGEYTTQYSAIAEMNDKTITVHYIANMSPCMSSYKKMTLSRLIC